MKDRVYLTKEEIKRVLSGLRYLLPVKKELISEVLRRLKADGVGREEFHRELWKLEKKHALTESDLHTIENAFFEDPTDSN